MDYEQRLWVRRGLGVLLPLGLLAVAGFLVQVPDQPEPSFALIDGGAPASTPGASGAVSSPSATPTSPATSPSSAVPPRDPDAPGVLLTVMPTSTGSLEVSETVTVDPQARSLVLAAPTTTEAGPAYADLAPRATQVQLMVDGRPVPLVSDEITQSVEVPLVVPAHTFEIRYVLEGATVRSIPSSTGRASILVAPLSRVSADADPVTIEAPSSAVRNVSCPLLSEAASACAQGRLGSLRVDGRVDAQTALFVLQTDLPKP